LVALDELVFGSASILSSIGQSAVGFIEGDVQRGHAPADRARS
jgi:hypothetical protein